MLNFTHSPTHPSDPKISGGCVYRESLPLQFWRAELVLLDFCWWRGGLLKINFKGSWTIWISKPETSMLQWYLEIGGINEDDNDLIRIIILSGSTPFLIIFEFLPSVMFHTRFKRKCQVIRDNCVLGRWGGISWSSLPSCSPQTPPHWPETGDTAA